MLNVGLRGKLPIALVLCLRTVLTRVWFTVGHIVIPILYNFLDL